MSMSMSRKAAFVFPGQGSQRIGMLEGLPEIPGFDRLLDAAEALSGQELRSLAAEGPEEALADTIAAQPLLYLADWAWATATEAAGVVPQVVAGHSLGELAALAFAGVYSVEAGLELVCQRSRLMAEAVASSPGGMMAVFGLERDRISETLAHVENAWIANDNSKSQVIISGTSEGLEIAASLIKEAGATRVRSLKVAGPFHSPLMMDAAARFADVLRGAMFSDARMVVLQNTLPEPTQDGEVIRERLIEQITSPVRWTETMDALCECGVDTVIETGPGRVLAGLGKNLEGLSVMAVDVEGISRAVEVICE